MSPYDVTTFGPMNEPKTKTKLTPVRYPGGKSNALKFLDDYLIKDFDEYREPFFGGGSVGLYLMQFNKKATYWINDLFYPVYCFWKTLYYKPDDMVEVISDFKKAFTVPNGEYKKGIASNSATNGRKLYDICRKEIVANIEAKDEFQTACLWYILNKTSYSGMAMIGAYTPLAWDQNFTDNCIAALPKTSELLHSVKNVRFDHVDYAVLLNEPSAGEVFIFLDPPYKIPHSLYGNEGELHEKFDHKKFADDVKACTPFNWLITYNNDPEIDGWFPTPPFNKQPWDLQYTMKAAKRTEDGELKSAEPKILEDGTVRTESIETKKTGKMGKELLIYKYEQF